MDNLVNTDNMENIKVNLENINKDNLERLKLIQLYRIAKKLGIKKLNYLPKANLIKAIQNPNQDLSKLYVGMCTHGVIKYFCLKCKGSQICNHNIQRTRCIKCNGGAVCQHKKRRLSCKLCEGSGICTHGINRNMCFECINARSEVKVAI